MQQLINDIEQLQQQLKSIKKAIKDPEFALDIYAHDEEEPYTTIYLTSEKLGDPNDACIFKCSLTTVVKNSIDVYFDDAGLGMEGLKILIRDFRSCIDLLESQLAKLELD